VRGLETGAGVEGWLGSSKNRTPSDFYCSWGRLEQLHYGEEKEAVVPSHFTSMSGRFLRARPTNVLSLQPRAGFPGGGCSLVHPVSPPRRGPVSAFTFAFPHLDSSLPTSGRCFNPADEPGN
jgi:hypothetical protein